MCARARGVCVCVCVWMVAVGGEKGPGEGWEGGGSGQTVAAVVGPAARHEEMREAVVLEVGVEEDHGVLRRLELLVGGRVWVWVWVWVWVGVGVGVRVWVWGVGLG